MLPGNLDHKRNLGLNYLVLMCLTLNIKQSYLYFIIFTLIVCNKATKIAHANCFVSASYERLFPKQNYKNLSWVFGAKQSAVMPDSDPSDGFFYTPQTPLIYSFSCIPFNNLPCLLIPINTFQCLLLFH